MEPSTLTLHSQFAVGRVDPRIFGGFMEHMGRCVYEGVYDPHSSAADENGYRRDVLEALDRLGLTVMRYPGGNFASGYHWMDGIGPADRRPTVRELAWGSIEPNTFGTEEFLALCRRMGWAPMMTANLGTGAPEEARNWVEYCNSPEGTRYADLRAAGGSARPHGVGLWCLGNEMDGPWQIGHAPASHYARLARQAGKMMKDVDGGIELVACGSSGPGMSTWLEWDREVLLELGDLADYISLHRYVGNREGDTPDFLATGLSIDRQIEEVDAVCRYVQGRRRSRKRAYLSFDEWNVWYKNMQTDGEGKFAPHLIEEVYNLEDALVVAGFLNSFLRHADVVKIANIAQVVNVIAPILTDGDEMLLQTIFHPFEMISKRREGISLRPALSGPAYETASHGLAPYLDASAVLDGQLLHVFVINRSLDEAAELELVVGDFDIASLESAETFTGDDPRASNTFDHPDNLLPTEFDQVTIADGEATIELPPLSFTALTFELE